MAGNSHAFEQPENSLKKVGSGLRYPRFSAIRNVVNTEIVRTSKQVGVAAGGALVERDATLRFHSRTYAERKSATLEI